MFSLQLTDLTEAQSHNGLSPGYKSNLVIKWQNIWHYMAFLQEFMRPNIKSMDFDMLFNANFTNLTNFSWICNQKWNIFKWSRYLTKDTFMLNLQCDPFYIFLLVLSLVKNTHFCSIPILLPLQIATIPYSS